MAKREGRRLATTTTVTGPDGTPYSFEPGTSEDEMPEGVAERIDNVSAWVLPISEDELEEFNLEPGSSYKDVPAKDLIELARDRGVELTSTTKADVIKALEANDAALAGTAQ